MCNPTAADDTGVVVTISQNQGRRFLKRRTSSLLPLFKPSSCTLRFKKPDNLVDIGCFLTYLFSTTVLNLPVVLLPVAAASAVNDDGDISSYIASIASVAVFGSALGKLVNGHVCQYLGNQVSSCLYMILLCLASKWFASGQLLYAYACMEFCASLQWTALSVLLMKKYASQPQAYSHGIRKMSLASTGGQFLAKALGMILLSYNWHWTSVANTASLLALLGAAAVAICCSEEEKEQIAVNDENDDVVAVTTTCKKQSASRFSLSTAYNDIKVLFSSRLFWVVGICHAASMLGRSSDRVLGAFFRDATLLPGRVCGGLTLASTFGLIHGLHQAKSFLTLRDKEAFLKRRYMGAIVASVALALVSLVHNVPTTLTAILICIFGFLLTSSTAFLFFQIPNLVANTFVGREAVCLSMIDAIGFFVAAPLWKLFGILIGSVSYTASWCMVAACFGIGGTYMMRILQPMFLLQDLEASRKSEE